MPDQPHSRPFALIAALQRAEDAMRKARGNWDAFRADPGATRLDLAWQDLRNAVDALDRLREWTEDRSGTVSQGSGPDLSEDRPGPREVAAAGRRLEAELGRILREWARHRRRPDHALLERLERQLGRAADSAAVLSRALRTLADRSVGEQAASDPARWRSPARASHRPDAGTLDSLIWRLHADWESARRAPAADRMAVVRDELRAARRATTELLRSDALATADPEEVAYLAGSREPVGFPAYRDAYTGAFNREGFSALAGAELKRCRRYDRPFGLVLIEFEPTDLRALRDLLSGVRSEMRAYDLIARLGDREVALALPEADPRATRRIVARLLRRLGSEQPAGHLRSLTYALMPSDGGTLGDLLDVARARCKAGTA
jgi:GGDEF domain-containing protein